MERRRGGKGRGARHTRRDWLAGWLERGPGVHSSGGAFVSIEDFSLLYPHLKCISEKDSANWLGARGWGEEVEQ